MYYDMLRDEIIKVGNLFKSLKRESLCCDDFNFVMSFNEFLKCRIDIFER